MKILIDNKNAPTMTSEDGRQVFGLYEVTLLIPRKDLSAFDRQIRHVLSTCEEDAIGMARCAAGVAIYHGPKEIVSQVVASVIRVPLTIQSWGNVQF